ncbi:MAG: hypothetical protein LPK07_14550 [Hymenobacteraceae bacterium]|nr:hypothetical protein [Hymenobacteraceae bacterium]MDX5482896.1 hypothetical protein [Hymenobacteraceae bacterium]
MTKMNKDFKLSDIPKHNVYQVPEGYFDRLPARVMERTAAAEKQQVPWRPGLWRPVRLALAPLLMLLLVFVGVYLTNQPAQPEDQVLNLARVSETEIMDYLSSYAILESSDFAELNNLREQELPAELLNVTPTAAEEELEYYHLNDIDY